MKKIVGIVVLGLLLLTPSRADDIRDFQIEGMSIGDSALNYLSKKKLLDKFEFTKNHYNYLQEPLKFREVYISYQNKSNNYDKISLMVKEEDPNYKIYFLRGTKEYNNQFDKCINQRNIISNEIEKLFTNYKKKESNFKNNLDKTGKSFRKQIVFIFDSGVITVGCSDWEEKLRKKNGWTEGLSVAILSREVEDWFGRKK